MTDILGFTGTRHMPTGQQCTWLAQQIQEADVLHHGACVGADAVAHILGLFYGLNITVHPPEDMKLVDVKAVMPRSELVTVLPAKPYHNRNRDIVNACDRLLALPDGPHRPHSGTWYTVDYATGKRDRRLLKHIVPVLICYPDGTVEPQ